MDQVHNEEDVLRMDFNIVIWVLVKRDHINWAEYHPIQKTFLIFSLVDGHPLQHSLQLCPDFVIGDYVDWVGMEHH